MLEAFYLLDLFRYFTSYKIPHSLMEGNACTSDLPGKKYQKEFVIYLKWTYPNVWEFLNVH